MENPVWLNGRFYNLPTLTSLPEGERNDPITGRPFTLADIKPAEHLAYEIAFLSQCELLSAKEGEIRPGGLRRKPYCLNRATRRPTFLGPCPVAA